MVFCFLALVLVECFFRPFTWWLCDTRPDFFLFVWKWKQKVFWFFQKANSQTAAVWLKCAIFFRAKVQFSSSIFILGILSHVFWGIFNWQKNAVPLTNIINDKWQFEQTSKQGGYSEMDVGIVTQWCLFVDLPRQNIKDACFCFFRLLFFLNAQSLIELSTFFFKY